MKHEDIPSKNISSMRQLVRDFSHFDRQGYLHCSCTAACKTNKWECKKSLLTCNSRCHSGKNVKIINNLCFYFAINLKRSTILSHYYFLVSFTPVIHWHSSSYFKLYVCCWLRNNRKDWHDLLLIAQLSYRSRGFFCRLRNYRIGW